MYLFSMGWAALLFYGNNCLQITEDVWYKTILIKKTYSSLRHALNSVQPLHFNEINTIV